MPTSTRRRAKPSDKLTPREARFVEEYLVSLNGTKSAIAAGYGKKSAHVTASQLLRKPNVAAALERAIAARSERTGITQDRVLQEIEHIAFSDYRHYEMDVRSGSVTLAPGAPDAAARAIASIKHRVIPYGDGDQIHELEVKFWDKLPALKIAGKHVGLAAFMDRVELTGKDGKDLVPAFALPADTAGVDPI